MKTFFIALALISTAAIAAAPRAYLASYVPLQIAYTDGKFTNVQVVGEPVGDFHECVKTVTKIVEKINESSAQNVKYLGQCLTIANMDAEILPNMPSEHKNTAPNSTEL